MKVRNAAMSWAAFTSPVSTMATRIASKSAAMFATPVHSEASQSRRRLLELAPAAFASGAATAALASAAGGCGVRSIAAARVSSAGSMACTSARRRPAGSDSALPSPPLSFLFSLFPPLD